VLIIDQTDDRLGHVLTKPLFTTLMILAPNW
jgi:hypothetical protein